ncbi:OmpH family outer membrane protein [Profundibacterium mesophilum]|uniref:tRNA delta-isopentenylpyrophosphate transferase Translation n=1 Tax=Profundibacterium mesophilum KAUST100406-0324 TaxID=1037889 RepID=A0A921NQ32_9RHOB|nr:OmpH family outer membrane protein [Profundibacterium mesophilum]KAF0675215.1 tRNA delta-isopentenylpyrophosphate transferase Translation [Profundibacterium mesophilum KAUST100406-0324]
MQPSAFVPTGILVVDQERLFFESVYGREILAEIDRRTDALAAENREIEAELVAEERELTERRSAMQAKAFRELAEAFDAKVHDLRQAQDAKVRDVTRLREEARQRFFGEAGEVLTQIVRERGAVVLMDRRSVLAAVPESDITDIAVARINAELGQGGADPEARAPGGRPLSPDASTSGRPGFDAPSPADTEAPASGG